MNSVNLIPQARRDARRRQIRLRHWAASATAYALLLTLACLSLRTFAVPANAVPEAEVQAAAARVQELRSTITQTQTRIATEQQLLSVVRTVMHQPDWSILLAFLARSCEGTVSLRSVKLQPTSGEVQSLPPTGARLSPAAAKSKPPLARPAFLGSYRLDLTATARSQADVSQFLSRLQQAGIFDEVKLVRSGSEASAGDPSILFLAQCTLASGGTLP